MAMQAPRESSRKPADAPAHVGAAIHAAFTRGLIVGRQVKIGIVRGVVIGYNIARRGRYRGMRYPLLVKTELGIAKCGLDEVVPA
jgi:hypothetical protein